MSFVYWPDAWIINCMCYSADQSAGHENSCTMTMLTVYGEAIPNLRPASCAACGRELDSLAGWAIRGPDGWTMYCTEFLLSAGAERQAKRCSQT